jgi:hypothetical protein
MNRRMTEEMPTETSNDSELRGSLRSGLSTLLCLSTGVGRVIVDGVVFRRMLAAPTSCRSVNLRPKVYGPITLFG